MIDRLLQLRQATEEAVKKVSDIEALNEIKVKVLGGKAN